MIYLLGGTKGGIGKSTMACNWAAALALHGRRVCLVDMDFQGHATSWVENRNDSAVTLPKVHCAQAIHDPRRPDRSVAPLLQSYAELHEDLVLDAGGRNSPELRAGLRVCDIVVMPFLASTFDLYTIEDMAELLGVAREYNPKLKALGFLNCASNNYASKLAGKAVEYMDRFSGSLRRAETIVHDLEGFVNSIGMGRGVMEMGPVGRRATDDFYGLFEEATTAEAA